MGGGVGGPPLGRGEGQTIFIADSDGGPSETSRKHLFGTSLSPIFRDMRLRKSRQGAKTVNFFFADSDVGPPDTSRKHFFGKCLFPIFRLGFRWLKHLKNMLKSHLMYI